MNGVINVLKPPAMSSGNVVGEIRKVFGIKKVGHTGTLDPGAAGVLPICVGRATKLADYIMNGEKEYIAEMTFGVETDTLDSYGQASGTCTGLPNEQRLLDVMQQFIGEIRQVPPAYSAVKHEGTPLYKLARKGVEIRKPERNIKIYGMELMRWYGGSCLFKIQCSKGTYIRTLVSDMAKAAGSCAYTSFLLRTKTGGFTLEDAYTLDEIKENKEKTLCSMESSIAFMPKVQLPEHLYRVITSGAAIDLKRVKIHIKSDTDYAVYCKNELICIAKKTDDMLKVATMLKI